MTRALLFGLGVGTAVQAWRNYPSDGAAQPDSVYLLCGVAVALAYLAGGARSRRMLAAHAEAYARATAAAVASSESTSSASNSTNVQVAVVVPGGGATHDRVSVPDPAAVSWLGESRAQVSADDLDGLDLSDVGLDVDAPQVPR